MDHIRIPFSDEVTHWFLGRLDAEAMASGDPEFVDRSTRGHRLVADRLAQIRAEAGLPPVGRHDPHGGHDVGSDPHGVEVCWSCSAADAAGENP
jgi:hypothetical protein